MGLLAPLGLIGLIGIPLLILIYIIKPKYQERTISSTYIWKLSQKYRKRKNPFDKITKSLLLILQIFCIALIAILITEPFYKANNEVVGEQIFILDGSASMNATDSSGKTRYEKAIDGISDKIKNSSEGVKNTVVFADSEPYYLVKRETDKNYIKHVLETTECTFEEADYSAAVKAVAEVAKLNSEVEVTLFTDHEFEKSGDFNVVDLSNGEWNASIENASISYNEGYYDFKTKVVSYNSSSKLLLELELKGVSANNNPDVTFDKKLIVTKEINLQKNVPSDVITFQNLNVYKFSQAKFTLKNTDGEVIEDSFDYDNEYYTFGGDEEAFNVQIISKNPTFIEKSLRSINKCNVQTKEPNEAINKGFDLYIYDSVDTQNLPKDGSVWIINPLQNRNYVDAGFSTSSEVSLLNSNKEDWVCLKGTSSEAISTGIMDSVSEFQDVQVSKHTLIASMNENYSVCMTAKDGSPLIFAGKNGLSYTVVMAFDLHYSNLPITLNMPILVSNMLEYSVKRTTEVYQYEIGEEVEINLKPNTENVKIVYAGVTSEYTDFSKPIVVDTIKGGVCYVIIKTTDSNTPIEFNFFVKISDDESDFTKKGKSLGTYKNPESIENENKIIEKENKDLSIWFAIGLLALLLVEWGVQYREQY